METRNEGRHAICIDALRFKDFLEVVRTHLNIYRARVCLRVGTHSVTQTFKYTLLPNSADCGIPGIDLIILPFWVVLRVIVDDV